VKKTVGSSTTVYIGKLYEKALSSGVTTKYIFAGNQRIALKASDGSLYYYHTDHLGSSSVVTSGSGSNFGSVVQDLAYIPYGKTYASLGSVDVHHKFTSQELDDSTGLYFYNARYYDPALGRFISPDTLVPSVFDPQSLNRYSYVRNNPVILTDPTGESFLGDLIGAFVGVVVTIATDNPYLGFAAAGIVSTGLSGGDPDTALVLGTAGSLFGYGFGIEAQGLATGLGASPGVAGFTGTVVGGAASNIPAAGAAGDPRLIAAGAAEAAIPFGLGELNGTPAALLSHPSVGFALGGGVGSVITGGSFEEGALNGLTFAGVNSVVSYAYYAATLPTYNGGELPPNSVGYALPKHPLSFLIALFEGGPFSHAFATDANGNPIEANEGVKYAEANLKGRGLLIIPGVLTNPLSSSYLNAMLVKNPSYSLFNIGGINCACLSGTALGFSGIWVSTYSPNTQFYQLQIYGYRP